MRRPFVNIFKKESSEDRPLGDTVQLVFEEPSVLLEHLGDLRKHLGRCVLYLAVTTALSFTFSRFILNFLAQPLPGGAQALTAIEVTEPLGTLMRITLLSGFALALPLIATELYLFIAPAVQSRNRRILGFISIPAVVILFYGGMAFTYFVILPTAIPFLLSILDIQTDVRPSSYIGFVTGLMFWIGLTFEFPIVILILASLGFVKAKTLARQWRLAIIIIAVISAIITPTIDPVNMALVMAPLIVLYFLSVGLAFIPKGGR